MQDGLYKVEYDMDGLGGHSMMFVHAGQMIGGNTSFSLRGVCRDVDGEFSVDIETRRHHPTRAYPKLLESSEATIRLKGQLQGGAYRFAGEVMQQPGNQLRLTMTPFEETDFPPRGEVGENGVVNGLYALEMRMPEVSDRVDTGVMLLHQGRILGCDAYFYYAGTYSAANSRWKGEFVVLEHTPAQIARPLFGGRETVGLGFSGTCDATSTNAEAYAFTGRRSIRFLAALKMIQTT